MPNSNADPGAEQTVTAYISVRDAARAISFYGEAFGAREVYRLNSPDGKVAHAEITFGNSKLMLSDEYPDFGAISPVTLGGSPVKFNVTVPDADKAVEHAVAAGCTLERPVKTEFYGQRAGMVKDPFGFSWFLSAEVEKLTPEEMQRRMSAMSTKAKTA